MTTQTKEVTRDQLLQEAAEAAELEQALVDQIANLPGRIAEARQAAKSRYNVMFAERLAGSTTEPVLDMSEAEQIAATEPELREKAKAQGIVKLRALAAVHLYDGSQHSETFENLGKPLGSLELQAARVNNDLKAVRNARMTAARKRDESLDLARQYDRAAALHESDPNPVVRM